MSSGEDGGAPLPLRDDGGALRVIAVVPAYNEEQTVGDVVRQLSGLGIAVVVVDDGSTDRTAQRAMDAGVAVVRLPLNLGVGGALRCGFRYALDNGYDVAVQCDADGQHPADLIDRLIEPLSSSGAHLVIGSRFAPGSDPYPVRGPRRAAMRLLVWLARRGARALITDTTSGFRAVRRPLLDEFARSYPAQYLGDTFEALVASGRAGYKIVEVPVRMQERVAGESSAQGGVALRYLMRAILAVVLRTGVRFRAIGERPDDNDTIPDAAIETAATASDWVTVLRSSPNLPERAP